MNRRHFLKLSVAALLALSACATPRPFVASDTVAQPYEGWDYVAPQGKHIPSPKSISYAQKQKLEWIAYTVSKKKHNPDSCVGLAVALWNAYTDAGYAARLVEVWRYNDAGQLKGHMVAEVDGWIFHTQSVDEHGKWWAETWSDLERRGYWIRVISSYDLREWYAAEPY